MIIIKNKNTKNKYRFNDVIEQDLIFGDYTFMHGNKNFAEEFIIKILTFEDVINILEEKEKWICDWGEELKKGHAKIYYGLFIESSPNKIFYYAIQNKKFFDLKILYDWSIKYDFKLMFLGNEKETRNCVIETAKAYWKHWGKGRKPI